MRNLLKSTGNHPFAAAAIVAAIALSVATAVDPYFWITADQQGQHEMNAGRSREAAAKFHDPLRQATAWYRAGEFEQAEQTFALNASAESEFNRGTCLVMQGKYNLAIERFDRALRLRPDFEDAKVNRAIAVARASKRQQKGGDLGDQRVGADEIVYDKDASSEGQQTDDEGGEI